MPTSHKKNAKRMRKAARDVIPLLIRDELSLRVGTMQGAEFTFYGSYREMTRQVQLVRRCAYHHALAMGLYNPTDIEEFVLRVAQSVNNILVPRCPSIEDIRKNRWAAFGMHPVNDPTDVGCHECAKLNKRLQCPEGMHLDPHAIVVFDKPDTVDRYTTLPYLQLDAEGADPKWSDPNNALLYLGHCENGRKFSQWGELPCPMGDHLGTRIPWHKLHPETREHIRMRIMEGN